MSRWIFHVAAVTVPVSGFIRAETRTWNKTIAYLQQVHQLRPFDVPFLASWTDGWTFTPETIDLASERFEVLEATDDDHCLLYTSDCPILQTGAVAKATARARSDVNGYAIKCMLSSLTAVDQYCRNFCKKPLIISKCLGMSPNDEELDGTQASLPWTFSKEDGPR